jgi:hypothetical protein
VREHDEAQWQHPEAEHRQKAKQSAKYEGYPHADAGKTRSGQGNSHGAENQLAGRGINAKTAGFPAIPIGICCRFALIGHPQEMVARGNNARECDFFEKTAWQIGKAFVLPRSHRAKRIPW